jgi:hypothetical protein
MSLFLLASQASTSRSASRLRWSTSTSDRKEIDFALFLRQLVCLKRVLHGRVLDAINHEEMAVGDGVRKLTCGESGVAGKDGRINVGKGALVFADGLGLETQPAASLDAAPSGAAVSKASRAARREVAISFLFFPSPQSYLSFFVTVQYSTVKKRK